MLLVGHRLCRRIACCAIGALALLVPVAACALPFGDNGIAIPPIYIPGGYSVPSAVLVQTDGKIVVAGTADGPLASTMFAARFTTAGLLDATYGTGGIAFVPLPEQAIQLQANAATLDRDGSLVIVGSVTYPASPLQNQNIAIVRLMADGSPDPTFGNGGFSEIPVDGTLANGVATDSQGRIVVVASPGFMVGRLTHAGSLDSSFNDTGLLTIVAPSYSSYQLPTSVQIGAGDSVVVGGIDEQPGSPDTPFTPFAVLRITNSGQVDSSFNGGSLLRLPYGDYIALDSVGRILVAGRTATNAFDGQVILRRVTTAGELDPALGVNGVAQFPFPGQLTIPSPLTIGLDSIGRIVVGIGGLGMQGPAVSAVRFTANGDIDTAFNGTGSQSVRLATGSSEPLRPTLMAIDALDGVFLAGSEIELVAGGIEDVFLARVDSSGGIDSAFASGGVAAQNCGLKQVTPTGLVEQPDGKLIISGYTGSSPFDFSTEFLVVRLTTSGALDGSFNGTGFRVLDVSAYATNVASALALDTAGNIILAGNDSSSSIAVARVTPNGALDTTFNGTGIRIVSGTSTDNGGATGVAIDGLGNIILVGQVPVSGGSAFGVVRLTSAGTLDFSFGKSGVVKIPLSTYGANQPTGVAIDSRGRIVVGGWYADPTYCGRFVAIRLAKAGILDSNFAGTGVATIPGCLGAARGVALAPADRVVVVGAHTLSRLTSSGSLDPAFGGTGLVTATTTYDTYLEAVTVDSAGRVFVVGDTIFGAMLGRRFTALGIPDATLNGGQPIAISPSPSAAGSRPVATLVDPSGNTYIAGQVGRSIAVIKLLSGKPSTLAVVSVNGGANPAADTPFAVILGAQDDSGAPQPVSQDTSIALALKQGSGSLTGTLTCIIPAGNTNCTVSGAVYSVLDTNVILSATTTAGEALNPGESFRFNVDQATTTTSLTSSINPSAMDQSVTFTGVVTGANPSGAIYFSADNGWIEGCGGVPLSGTGNAKIATCTTNQLYVGTHPIVAVYYGDTINRGSSSPTLSQVVNLASADSLANPSFEIPALGSGFQYNPNGTGIGWTFSAGSGIQHNGSAWGAASAPDGTQTAFIQNTSTISQALNLNAGNYTLAFKAAQRACCLTPSTQPIKVTVDGIQIGSLITPAGTSFGSVSIPFTLASSGTHTIALAGSNPNSNSTFIDAVTVSAVVPGTTLVSSLNPARVGKSLTLTATVTGSNPTGIVAFTSNGSPLAGCSAVLVAGSGNSRTAQCPTSFSTKGTYSIVAGYGGDASNPSTTSAVLSEVVKRR